MDTLVNTASSTFTSTMGFNMSEVVDTGVDFLGLAFGTGLAFFTEVLPVLLAVVVIYAVYRIAKYGWHRVA